MKANLILGTLAEIILQELAYGLLTPTDVTGTPKTNGVYVLHDPSGLTYYPILAERSARLQILLIGFRDGREKNEKI